MEISHTFEVSNFFPQKEPRQLAYREGLAFGLAKLSP